MPCIYCEPDLIVCDGTVVQYSGKTRMPGDGTVELRGHEIFVCAPNGISFLTLRWKQRMEGRTAILGDAFERSYGDLEWRGIVPERVMPWYCVAVQGTACEGYGVRVRPNAFCYWQLDQAGISLTLDLRCGGSDAFLRQELCAAELVYLREDTSPFAFLQRFCLALSDHPKTAGRPVYGSISWYYLYAASSSEQILKDARLMAELGEGLDSPPYTVVDCGWSEPYTPNNPVSGTVMAEGNARYGDMGRLSDDIHSFDVRSGLWVRPLCVSGALHLPRELLLRPDMPDFHEGCIFDAGTAYLDPSVPEALEIIAADMHKVAVDWGYDLIKPDFLTFDLFGEFHSRAKINCTHGNWHFHDTGKTSAQIVKMLYETIAKNAGDAIINGCNCIGHLSSGYFHTNRIGDDISGKEFDRTRLMGVNSLAYRLCQHKAFFDADSDCVAQTDGMPWAYNRQWLELVAMSGTPLFVAFHPDRITQEQKSVLRACFQQLVKQQGSVEPLDFLETTSPERYLLEDDSVREFSWIEPAGVTKFTFDESPVGDHG